MEWGKPLKRSNDIIDIFGNNCDLCIEYLKVSIMPVFNIL